MSSFEHRSDVLDLTELDTLLSSDRVRPGCFNLSELDGLLAAILVGPVWMSSKAWLPLIWGEAEPEWADDDEAGRVSAMVRTRYDQVSRQLAEDPDSYAPIFRRLPDGSVAADDWALGFMAGTELHPREWDALVKHPKWKHFLVAITSQLSVSDDKIMADFGRDAVLEFRRQGRAFIAYSVVQIRSFWAKQRHASRKRPTPDLLSAN